MIYAVGILDNRFIKIGYCKDQSPDARIATLQTGNPFEIKLIACVDGTLRQEKSLHAALNEAFERTGWAVPPNEWYPGNSKFMRAIAEAIKYGPNFAIMVADEYLPSRMRRGANRDKSKWPEMSKTFMRNAKFGTATSFKKTAGQLEQKEGLSGRKKKKRRKTARAERSAA